MFWSLTVEVCSEVLNLKYVLKIWIWIIIWSSKLQNILYYLKWDSGWPKYFILPKIGFWLAQDIFVYLRSVSGLIYFKHRFSLRVLKKTQVHRAQGIRRSCGRGGAEKEKRASNLQVKSRDPHQTWWGMMCKILAEMCAQVCWSPRAALDGS